eukprot:sb/3462734/
MCNGKCEAKLDPSPIDYDDNFCHDEVSCNGYSYGIIQGDRIYPFTTLLPTSNISALVDLGTDTCETDLTDIRFPLYNGSRCFTAHHLPRGAFCKNGHDQTNCSDPTLVVGKCQVGGFLSTISKYITCPQSRSHDIRLCDNGLDRICEQVSPVCRIHRHLLCNQVIDCIGGADEDVAHCGPLTDRMCERAFYPGKVIAIPVRWVQDGVPDCQNGEDEKGHWDRCGEGSTSRVRRNTSCTEVFYCTPKREIFTELSDLCQPQSECGYNMCPISRRGLTVSSLISFNEATSIIRTMPQCMKGIDSIRNLASSTCDSVVFSHKYHDFFGKTPETRLIAPTGQMDCRFLFGEAYLFYSCIGMCLGEVRCPIERRAEVSSCTNFISGRLHALAADNSHVTTVIRMRGGYHNNVFVCSNNRCIPFSKVCNLDNDCGDGSDEKDCENNWMCEDGSAYLSINQFCNGKQDCHDFSDECNDTCRRKFLNTKMLIVAVIIGSAGLLLNIGNMMNQSSPEREKNGHFINRTFAFLISLGDLMTNLYLLGLVTVHLAKGTDFCKTQLQWLTSPACGVLGTMSTTGTITSSFSMIILSFFRLHGTVKASRFQRSGELTKKIKVRVHTLQTVLVLLAATIATIPVVPWLNDWFVNGLTFENNVRIFLGIMDKNELHDVIQRYHRDP